MFIDSYETNVRLKSITETDINNYSYRLSEVNASNNVVESHTRSWSESVDAIDLLSSPKYYQTVKEEKIEEKPTDGPLDLECLYYDQFEYNSSPELISPKREVFESSNGSQIFGSENLSNNSITYTDLQTNQRPRDSSDLSLESVIDDAISLESSYSSHYSTITSSNPVPNTCEWIDCFTVFKSQKELV